ncbi:MAG: hypothetical protein WA324_24115 [Bryobacteraceae bacterium]
MSVFTIHRAKTSLSRWIQKALNGEEVIIASGSKPVAKLVALGDVTRQRQAGAMKGTLKVGPEFFDPLPEDELSAWT